MPRATKRAPDPSAKLHGLAGRSTEPKGVEGDDPNVITHDPTNRQVAAMLILMPAEAYPIALGVIYEDPRPTFESAVIEQNTAVASGKTPDLQALVAKGQTWMVEKEPHQI